LSQAQVPFVAATIAGGLLAALVAGLVGIPVLRLRGHYLAVATLGLMVIVRVVAVNWNEVTRGAKGINGLPAYTDLWWAYGWLVVTLYVVWRLVKSPYGRAMMAIREDEVAAAARGVNVTAHRTLAFCVGAFFAGAAGALWGHLITAITPQSFSFLITFNVVVMLVVGGMGSISGSVIGATLMTLVPEFLRRLETAFSLGGHPLYGLSQIIIAITITLVMIFRRQGLLGGREIVLPQLFGPRRGEVGDQVRLEPGPRPGD
jgi:branched-chain amino acid transport system permease protein